MVCSQCILNPQGSTGSSAILMSNESPINDITPKFQLQIYYTLAFITENVPTSSTSVPISIFLCINIPASSQCYIIIFVPREKRSNLEVKLYKMCLSGQSVKNENTHVKIGKLVAA